MDLLPEEYSVGLNPERGRLCLLRWINGLRAFSIRYCTTHSDIVAALDTWPELSEKLRADPGPYAELLAERDAEAVAREVDQLLRNNLK